jgi:hypothetical protein
MGVRNDRQRGDDARLLAGAEELSKPERREDVAVDDEERVPAELPVLRRAAERARRPEERVLERPVTESLVRIADGFGAREVVGVQRTPRPCARRWSRR